MRQAGRVLFWIVVAASLLANAVVLGLFLALADVRQALNGGSAGFRDLPPDIRVALRQSVTAERGALQGQLRALGSARRAMVQAAAARPYDPAALEAAMAEVRRASAELQTAAHAVLARAAAQAASGD